MNSKTITMTIGLISAIAITPLYGAEDAKTSADVKGSCCVAMNTSHTCGEMSEKQSEPAPVTTAPEEKRDNRPLGRDPFRNPRL